MRNSATPYVFTHTGDIKDQVENSVTKVELTWIRPNFWEDTEGRVFNASLGNERGKDILNCRYALDTTSVRIKTALKDTAPVLVRDLKDPYYVCKDGPELPRGIYKLDPQRSVYHGQVPQGISGLSFPKILNQGFKLSSNFNPETSSNTLDHLITAYGQIRDRYPEGLVIGVTDVRVRHNKDAIEFSPGWALWFVYNSSVYSDMGHLWAALRDLSGT